MLKRIMAVAAVSGLALTSALAQTTTPPATSTSPTTPPTAAAPSTPAPSTSATTTAPAGKAQFVTKQTSDQHLASKFNGTDVIGTDDAKIGDVSVVLFV
jgi:hypothetical protein